MKKNKRLFTCILSFLLVITFSFNTYNIKRVNASVTAVSSAVLVSNPEILIPVLGVGAVATSLRQSHSNAGSEPRLRPTPQLRSRIAVALA